MEHREVSSSHTVFMYVLIALLFVALGYIVVKDSIGSDNGSWQCVSRVCSKYIDPQEWVQRNCGQTIAPNGSSYASCTLAIEGVNTSIPLSSINLTYVGQQCEAVSCIQEVRVRPVNYTTI